ncbi:MAG TPA: nucleoside hydrolase [Planctomycetota bacterium]|nr:nucleoside hydrolase [Planctomycetota bacterium]
MSRVSILLLALCACASPPAAERPLAPWPPPAGPLRVLIDTDAANEVDDLYALALALGFPERISLEGIVAAHFGKAADIDKSMSYIDRVLELSGKKGKIRTARGIAPLKEGQPCPGSDGIDLILERARAGTPQNPLWLILLGPVTDGVAALERDPSIADRVVIFWHGRSKWPVECKNFNATNDRVATRRSFEQASRFVLFDTGAQLTIPMEETERRFAPLGPLGTHLHEIRRRNPHFTLPTKGMFDLGDIAALIDPACAPWEKTAAPTVQADLKYDFSTPRGELIRIEDVDRNRCFDLLEEALRRLKN